MTKQIKTNILEWLSRNEKDIMKISKEIWEYSELPMQETNSCRLLSNWLSKEGFRVETGTSGMPTAFLAEFSSGSGSPVIVFLAEYDALPGNSNKVVPRHEPIVNGGVGHGCGHNLIGTGNAAAAIAVKNAMLSRAINGTIRVYGTPAEELLVAKAFMARDGLFNDCDVILTSHPGSLTAANANPCYALISTEFTFRGESCHMPSMPEVGRNALDAAQLAIMATNMRKKHMEKDTVIEYVIPDGGYQPNVVPDEAKVWYFVRHPDVNSAKNAYQKILEAVKGAAIATGTTSEERLITGCYGYLPNERLGKLIYENANMVGSLTFSDEEKRFANELRKNYGLKEIQEPLHEGIEFLKGGMELASQDDGDASWLNPLGRINCAFPRGIPFHGWGFTAVSGSSIGHKGMIFCSKTLGTTAADILLFPEVVQEIKREHKERTKDFEYSSLVPDHVKPITEDFMKHHVKTRW
jgi:aminobenzoyl-glutamate utilization protein B